MSDDPFLAALGGAGPRKPHPMVNTMVPITIASESAGNPNAVSPKGARGIMQVMPDTARNPGFGITPSNGTPEDTARVGREHLSAMMDRYNGNPAQAWAAYNWGPGNLDGALAKYGANWLAHAPAETQAYVRKNMERLGGDQAPADMGDPNDPFLSALNGDRGHGNASNVPAPSAGNAGGSGPDNGRPVFPVAGDPLQNQQPQAQAGPAQDSPSRIAQIGRFGHDVISGVFNGVDDVVGQGFGLAARLGDFTGITHGALDRHDQFQEGYQKGNEKAFYDPNSWARAGGRVGGNIAALAPVTALRPLQALGAEGKLGATLAKYGDYAAQGAAAGTVMSGGHDIAENAALGAVTAPVLGAAIEKVAAPALVWAGSKAMGAAEPGINAVKALAERIKTRSQAASEMAPETGPAAPNVMPAEVRQGMAKMLESGASADDVATAYPYWSDAKGNRAVISWWANHFQKGGKGPVKFAGEAPKPSDPAGQATREQLAAAIGDRAQNRGISATRELPQGVATRASELEAQGVPKGEALRQADIEAIGAKPAVAHVTRSFDDMHALVEGAKHTTPEGAALREQLGQNNAALHSRVNSMVQDYGGTPAEGEAAQLSAQTLADASDAAKTKVSQLYEAARTQDGDQRISVDALREKLNTPRYKASSAWAGLRRQLGAMSKENGNRFTPDQIDELTQIVNDQYNPMGGSINSMVGDLKGALNESLDQFDKAGPAFKAARAAHREWASQYDNPAGVARLIRRDAQGNFLHEDNWRSAEGFTGGKHDKSFVQVVKQLKAIGGEDAVSRLKATILQNVYEKAKVGNPDAYGNRTISSQGWNNALDAVGMPKLREVFSPDEIANLAHVGRVASYMNEPMAGANNTSGTTAAYLNAVRSQGGKLPNAAKLAIHLGGQGVSMALNGVTPGIGNAVAGAATAGITRGGESISNAVASRRLASALSEMMDPEAARAADVKRITSEIEKRRIAQLSRALAARTAPAAATERNRSN